MELLRYLYNKQNDNDTLKNINFSENDIMDAIKELSPSSAPGPDGFPSILLIKCKENICKPLYLIYRKSLDTGKVPEHFKQGHITPIHKGGDQGLPSNYRPVTLTSHLIKTFEKIIRKDVVKHLDKNNLFNKSQHGFRAGHSCLSQLLQYHDKILTILEQGYNVDTIYLDFSKAFDKVDINILLKKIAGIGISGKLFKWISAFLSDRVQTVLVDRRKSYPAKVVSGVPQGSVLGPLLFLIMISDIDADLKYAFISSFADDTRISNSIHEQIDTVHLQNDLQTVYAWAKNNNNMSFNNNKFELLRHGHNETLKLDTQYTNDVGDPIYISYLTSYRNLSIIVYSKKVYNKLIEPTSVFYIIYISSRVLLPS